MNIKVEVLKAVQKEFKNEKNQTIPYYQLHAYAGNDMVEFKTTKEVYDLSKELKYIEKTVTLTFEQNGRAKVIDIK